MLKQAIFRVDSSYNLGFGHLKRCINFAEQISKSYRVTFICKKYKTSFNENVKKFKLVLLPPNLNTDQEIIFFRKKIIPNLTKTDWIIKDNYNLTYEWEKKIYSEFKNLFVIDDYYNKKHICKRYLNQNFLPVNKINLPYKADKYFLGPKYSLISKIKLLKKNKKKCLIFFGGSDDNNYTQKLIKIILKLNLNKYFFFSVIIGKQNKSKEKLIEIIKKKKNFNFFYQSNDFQKLVNNTNYFIGSGGTTTWEMLKRNINCILITSSKNQDIINKSLKKMKFIELLNFKQKNFNLIMQKFFLKKKLIKKFNLMKNHNYNYEKFLK